MSVRLANAKGRAVLLRADGAVDVERASGGKFSADPMDAVGRWDKFCEWAQNASGAAEKIDETTLELGPPVPRPAKVFAIGMNYREHAKEAGLDIPTSPVVFTKFPNCLTGPRSDVVLSSDWVDWEVELVVVMGRGGRRIAEAKALEYVAGYTAGQDVSDRMMQFADKPPQFSMGKSVDTFGPLGPSLVSLDAFRDPNDLALTCDVAGERMQEARTSDLIFSVAELVAFLSKHCTLDAGDIIFTGTPSGVGSTRNPRRYLKAGEEIVSEIEGIGRLVNRCVSGPVGTA